MMGPYRRANSSRTAREDLSLKETSPNIIGKMVSRRGPANPLNLVEQMQYLYVRVVRVRGLPKECNPYFELKNGNYKASSVGQNPYPEWNLVFAFRKEKIQVTSVEILVKDHKSVANDPVIGRFVFNVADAPNIVPPDGPLAPTWYNLVDDQNRTMGELMVSFWFGTQADVHYNHASRDDSAVGNTGVSVANKGSVIHTSPNLVYLRVTVIQAQDLLLRDKNNRRRSAEVLVRASVGRFVSPVCVSETKTENPKWNEEFLFVVAEPLQDNLVVSVDGRVSDSEDFFCLGRCEIPLEKVGKRETNTPVSAKWYDLWIAEEENQQEVRFASKIQMKISLDTGYHVHDEPFHSSSDFRPTSKALRNPQIGTLNLGILSASGLPVMQPNNSTDAYCVCKYGEKWQRTSTVVDTCDPRWDAQCKWNVYDPCTVITIGVFQDGHLHGEAVDLPMGKVKIRLSTLQTNKIYKNSFPLVILQPSGIKKMGEIQLTVQFVSPSIFNLLLFYSTPLLPKMHYLVPLPKDELSNLSNQAAETIKLKLSKCEPPVRPDVVDYILDVKPHLHLPSTRRIRVNFQRIINVLSGFRWFLEKIDYICKWNSGISAMVCTVLLVYAVFWTAEVLKWMIILTYASIIGLGLWNFFFKRDKKIPHIDAELSLAYRVGEDVLAEEFDPLPAASSDQVLARRYDRLRMGAWHVETLLGDIATQLERVQALLSWRDPRATFLFMLLCLIAAIGVYNVDFKDSLFVALGYVIGYVVCPLEYRHLISFPVDLFRRMPAKTDILL